MSRAGRPLGPRGSPAVTSGGTGRSPGRKPSDQPLGPADPLRDSPAGRSQRLCGGSPQLRRPISRGGCGSVSGSCGCPVVVVVRVAVAVDQPRRLCGPSVAAAAARSPIVRPCGVSPAAAADQSCGAPPAQAGQPPLEPAVPSGATGRPKLRPCGIAPAAAADQPCMPWKPLQTGAATSRCAPVTSPLRPPCSAPAAPGRRPPPSGSPQASWCGAAAAGSPRRSRRR